MRSALLLAWLLLVSGASPANSQGTGSGRCYFGCPGGNTPPETPRDEVPRDEVSPRVIREFKTYRGFDLPGGDYGSPLKDVSFDTCQSACADDESCVAFTYDKRNNWCFLKSRITGLDPNEKAISGALASENVEVAQAERSFRTYEGYDVPGGDYGSPLKNVNNGDCRNACAGDAACLAFTYDRRNKWCFLKSRVGQLQPNGQATSGVLTSISLD